ncbi:hypothetical protein [Nocardioides sp. cx-173]|uniref:hypothetical protein n=1 Tax=Nocardioides sp. cx-173 TaxID=2898796 RepID=UPI001E437C2C|nr:hypothetical protein [Nocardioides sp. cx-173]MCD4526292.1 hypothetical protein [Nocardioides sp. cx-173]UGB43468.1 hypothetical protein LQ940_08050 [Nocardioides sp. cx-173]
MRTRLVKLLVATLTAGGLMVAPAPATQADVQGDVVMVGEKPVAGTYDMAYNNYSEKMKVCTMSRERKRDYYCEFHGYRVARGKMHVKLHTYRVREGMRKYDFYVLDVDVDNTDRYGKSKKGWMKVHIENVGAVKLVDFSDTTSVSATKADCAEIGLSIGHSVGPASASMDWGSVRFCDKQARYYIEGSTGDHTVYEAEHTRQISSLSSQRIVKVPRGKRPVFSVTVHLPNDDCTKTGYGNCTAFKNSTYLKTWKIGTRG